jgi:hypothetical protein
MNEPEIALTAIGSLFIKAPIPFNAITPLPTDDADIAPVMLGHATLRKKHT